ncbi:hypothetical protein [Planobispora longispora]|uniref:Secreted protein n=1 Tax=Planobispora longispora TaxID=28887 RepID=A0A8J3RGG0_9ACTN|nr:hypothetical protein [Planobispora longispora]BFE85061.1 hypothetical protein GCM10020093_076620 [Planobispora longispora]GIH75247.1 hypothetical protein Plo01_16760 [Planobispora longispora]
MRIRILATAVLTAGALMATLSGAASADTPETPAPPGSPEKGKIVSVVCEAGADKPTVTVRELTDAEAGELAERLKEEIGKAGEAGGSDSERPVPGERPEPAEILEGKVLIAGPEGAGLRPEDLPEGVERARVLPAAPGEPPVAGESAEKFAGDVSVTCAAPVPVPESGRD